MLNDSIDNLRLDLNNERVRGTIYVRRNDTKARTIHLSFMSNGKVVDLSNAVFCALHILKPDLNECDQPMVRYGNELQYTFRTQDINVPGECKCQAQVTFNDGALLEGPEFSVMVHDTEINPKHEESLNEYGSITQILVDVTNLKTEAEADANRAESAREGAEESEEKCDEDLEECMRIVSGLHGTFLPQGTINFADLADVSKIPGYEWKITDEFTTDNRFSEGAGHVMAAGTSVYVTINEEFTCITGDNVVGVKGDSEVNYRTGNVNLTKANIGLGNVPNVTTNNQTPTFSMAVSRENIASGETLATIMGKLMKYLNDLKTVSFSGNYSDLSGKPDYDGLTSRVTNLETAVTFLESVAGYPFDWPEPEE